ncbi:hypothetical protein DENIS_1885 [Desulfonema ishimotonii]|uniref:Glycosyltransferase subfamily 4-like N-terminal domain-containing protein n=1 Tax=Desulfonema ishimotonii TaxID=45657 RepID=A0A401FVD5_9BACT|nr:glycosyltransferase family 4 protein [Desulfonema ishimotonii]GBC60925.1 hypothetical protein DENIS_1885 [Desulfonema ishimotonii]
MAVQSRKKLCLIIPSHWSGTMGGTEYQVRCLLERLVREGRFDIYYLTRRYDAGFRPDGYRIIRIAGTDGIRRYGRCFDGPRLMRLLYQIRPDVIYQRNGGAYTGFAAAYARRYGCRMIWHIAHEDEVLPFQERFSMRSAIRCIDRRIFEYGIQNACHIIAQTRQQGHLLETYHGRRPDAVIPNFHPLPSEQICKEDAPVTIAWVANFKSWKQPEVFIRLAGDLEQRGEKVRCVMVGAPADWAPEWQRSLEEKIRRVRNLTCLGRQSVERVNAILAAAHIFVNTSLAEGFANTFIQAWMRSVPVVSLHCNPDGILEREGVGFFSGSYGKMLADVVRLIRNPGLRTQMGVNAQGYAAERHSERNIVRLTNLFAA